MPVTGEIAPLQEILDDAVVSYQDKWMAMTARKLGLRHVDPGTDPPLIFELYDLLRLKETDFTLFFRGLFQKSGPFRTSSATPTPPRRDVTNTR